MEAARRSNVLSATRAASSPMFNDVGKDPRPGGSGTGSSTDSLASEVGRLSEENARYRQKIADLMGKGTVGSTPAAPSRGPSNSHLSASSDRVSSQPLPPS